MATVRKRSWQTKDGPQTAWIADYFAPDETGKMVRRQKTFSRQKDAKDWLPKTHQEIKQGTHTPDSVSSTLQEAIDAWIRRGEAEGLESSTMRQRRLHQTHILALLDSGVKLSRYSVPKLEAFRDELLLKHSRAMARKVIVSLRSILKQAKAGQLASADLKVKSAGRHQRKLKVGADIPTAPEFKAVIEAAADDPKAHALVCLAGFAGLRASEMRGLAWSNLKLGGSPSVTIEERADELGKIGSPKSDASKRTIGLNATTVQALKAWKIAQPPIVTKEDGQERRHPRTLVFGTSGDRPDGLPNIRRRLLGPAMVKAGVVLPVLDAKGKSMLEPIMRPKYTGLHCLRHFAVSSWLKTCGGDFKAVQVRAGHATLALTLDTYGHLLDNATEGDQIAAAERLVLG